MRFTNIAVAVLSVMIATSAEAQSIELSLQKDSAKWTCNQTSSEYLQGAIRLRVTVTPGDSAAVRLTASYKGTNGESRTAPLRPEVGGVQAVTIQHRAMAPDPVTLGGTVGAETVNCGPFSAAIDLDGEAQHWLTTQAAEVAEEELRLPTRVKALYHLPSGRVAADVDASLSERDDYMVVVIIDKRIRQWGADVKVEACPDREPFRILGNLKEMDVISKPSVAKPAEAPAFALLRVERPLRCGAGTMQYALTVSRQGIPQPPQTTNWRIRPVYHLAATYGLGFDFAKRPSYSVEDGKIAKTEDYGGTAQHLGFTWFPGGVDYERMRWYNHILNPFILFSLDAPKESFVLGTALTVTGGLSISVGASVEKVSVLRGEAKVGDLVTGDPPVTKQWKKEGVGWYLGFTLDQNLMKALKGMMPGGMPQTQ